MYDPLQLVMCKQAPLNPMSNIMVVNSSLVRSHIIIRWDSEKFMCTTPCHVSTNSFASNEYSGQQVPLCDLTF